MKLPVNQSMVDANVMINKSELTDSDYQSAKTQGTGELSSKTKIVTTLKNEDLSSSNIETDDIQEKCSIIADYKILPDTVELTDSNYLSTKTQDTCELRIKTEIVATIKNEELSSSIIITDDIQENHSRSTNAYDLHSDTTEPIDLNNQSEVLKNDIS